jgi:hypothetical protein
MEFVWPPFQSWDKRISPAVFTRIKRAGFDFVRMPIEPGVFIDFEGERRDLLFTKLDTAVGQILDAGLNVIVDYHYYPVNLRWNAEAILTSPNSPKFIAYRNLIRRTAKMLSRYDAHRVALELMNEPSIECRSIPGRDWGDFQPLLLQSARQAAPKLTIAVTGGCWGGLDGLRELNPATLNDRNLLYSFHFYEPFMFTHQGTHWITDTQYLGQIPYPARREEIARAIGASIEPIERDPNLNSTQKKILKDKTIGQIITYFYQNWNRDRLESEINKAVAWAKRHQIPTSQLLMGEFGVFRSAQDPASVPPGRWVGASDRDRVIWHRDLVELARKYQIPWSMWSYGGNFNLANNRDLQQLDSELLKVLGLNSLP